MKVAAQPFRTNFYLWNGVAALFFSSCITTPHSHNTMQIFVDLQDGFKCKINHEEWKLYHLLILRENVVHQLNTNGSVQLLIYLDKDTEIARRLKETYLGGADASAPNIPVRLALHPETLQRAILQPDPDYLFQIINDVFKSLAGPESLLPADERLRRMELAIAACPPELLNTRHLASLIFLSESRLRAIFRKQAGVSLHKYLMWTRLKMAINQVMAGSSINTAAMIAGFSDSSHFHKMLVQMFGVSPSAFIKSNRSMRIITCDNTPLRFESSVYDKERQLLKVYK